ncbi:hypothetical protein ACFVFS_09030 [Kitasatospora sp. NPDC057692]|uniref:hypothetical protein n=1 Tax=Kitasatospora sp. NPDC057692 TaxID=3346215 RepID=UPI0036BE3ED9
MNGNHPMNRLLAILATSAALTVAGTTGATAATGTAASGTAAPGAASAAALQSPAGPGLCVTGYRGVVVNEICATVSGDQVTFYGQSSPGSLGWTARTVPYRMTASVVGGAVLGTITPTVLIDRSATAVGRITATAPCGSNVTASLETTAWGWPPATATITVPVGC